MLRSHLLACVGWTLVVSAGFVKADPVEPHTAYSTGASAYFAGRTDKANEHLTAAIEFAPDDPRAYYLRGLNHMAVGNMRQAQLDLSKGAELEARGGSASPLVDRSLSSVQGSARLTLERIRRAARESAVVAERRRLNEARRQARGEREQRVLRTDFQLPIEALASRLTIDQARDVAIKTRGDGSATGTMVASTNANTSNAATNSDAGNPFIDDADKAQAPPATTTTAAASTPNDVDVPDEARGSMSRESVSGILSIITDTTARSLVADKASAIANAIPVPSVPGVPMGPGAAGPMGPDGFPAEGEFSFEGGFPPDGEMPTEGGAMEFQFEDESDAGFMEESDGDDFFMEEEEEGPSSFGK